MYNFTLDSEKFIVSVGSIISLNSSGTVGITGVKNVGITSSAASIDINAKQNISETADQNVVITASNGMAKMSANTYATVISSQDAEISGSNSTNVGFSSGGTSLTTTIKGDTLTAEPTDEGTFGSAGALVTVVGSDVKING